MSVAHDIFYNIAVTINQPLAIDAIIDLKDPNLDELLASNKNLTTEQRTRLHKTSTVTTARILASTAFGDEQLRQMLADPRQKVRFQVFANGFPAASNEFLEELTSTWMSRSEANLWLESSTRKPPKQFIKRVARYSFYQSSFEPMADPEIFTLQEAQTLLSQIHTKVGENRLCALTDRRPELLPYLNDILNCKEPSGIDKPLLLTALITSRHIFDQELLASFTNKIRTLTAPRLRIKLFRLLATNPNLSPETTTQLARLVSRSKASGAREALEHILAVHKMKVEFGHPTSDWTTIADPEAVARIEVMIGDRYLLLNQHPYPTMPPPATQTKLAKGYATALPDQQDDYQPVDLSTRYLALYPEQHPIKRYKLRATTFNHQVAPAINPLGKDGWDLFFSLSLSWRASVADLIAATLTALV